MTGVQTCALPISSPAHRRAPDPAYNPHKGVWRGATRLRPTGFIRTGQHACRSGRRGRADQTLFVSLTQMRASYARRTTLTYASAAVLCVTLPLVVPAEHGPVAMTMALFVGAPLAVLAVLLALLHIAVGLQARVDWLIATVFAVAAVLGMQPMCTGGRRSGQGSCAWGLTSCALHARAPSLTGASTRARPGLQSP